MKNKERQKRFLTLTLALTFFLMSCAAPERKFPEIFWPLPPEEPRIKFVETLESNLDVEEGGGFVKAVAGEDVIMLSKPYGVTADKDGRVYVTDRGIVFVFDRKDKKLWFIGREEGPAALKKPANVAVSQDGRIYVSDTGDKKIFVYDKSGKFLTTIGYTKGELENPIGLAIDDKRQRLYVVDSKKHHVRVYSLDGKALFTIGEGKFNTPSHIALDSEGNIYVVETQGFRYQVFDPEGKHIRSVGGSGDAIGEFGRPKGIAIDSEDHAYVVDASFQNVQIFDKEGKLLMFFGEGGSARGGPAYGRFYLPAGIAIDDEDRIYVADTLNSRIQVFQYLGEKWKKKQAEQLKK